MKNSTTWTAVAAAAALLALPVSGMAQTPQTQPPTAATQTQTPAAQQPDTAAAREHLSKARAALNDVTTTNAKAKTQIAELKRRLATLERVAGGEPPAATAKGKAGANWGTEVAAMDKALTTLLGPDSATGAAGTTNPPTTGTTGSTAQTKAAAATLDEASRTKLMEVRQHITAFATVMAGGKTEPANPEPTAPSPTASTTSAAGTTATTGAAGTTGSATSATGTSGTSATSATAAQPPATDPAQQTGQAQVDEGAARRHLTEARNTLSAMTQLPAAAQLTGDARTHISQLISNFNELITAQSQWRASYDKVEANLTALVGADTTTAATGTTGTSGTGTAGAVGTSGSGVADLDPAIRQKLIELRKNLSDFERAAGGEAAAGSMTQPATAATATTGTAATGTSGTTGSTATTGAAGTTGAATSSSTPPAAASATTADPAAQNTTAQAGNADIMRHVAAIDALLKLQDDSGGLTLTKTQVEQLRTHWAALRQALDRK